MTAILKYTSSKIRIKILHHSGWVYKRYMAPLDWLFLGLQQQKISTEDQEMAEDSVPVDASTIQELIKL